VRRAGIDHADVLGRTLGKIEDTATDEGSAVVDADDNALAVATVRDLEFGPEAQ